MDNEQLAARAKDGGQEALFNLYQNNQGMTKKMCRSIAADDFEFEDLMQESYFVLLKAVDGYNPDQGIKFISYYTKALKWNLLRYKRYNGRKESLTLDTSMDGEEGSEERIDNIPDPNTLDPNDRLEMEFLRQQLDLAITKLPERQANMLTQYYFKERPTSELANIFQTTVKGVWHDLTIGRDRLRRDKLLRKTWHYWTGYFWDTEAYRGTGFSSFRLTRTSSVERVALDNVWTEEKILSFLANMKAGEAL